jgi:hypothetical protein
MTLCKRPSAHTPIHFPLPPADFQRNPPGRGRLAVFPPPWRIDPYESRYGRFTASPARTALKNSQLTRRPPGDISIICETVHTSLVPAIGTRITATGTRTSRSSSCRYLFTSHENSSTSFENKDSDGKSSTYQTARQDIKKNLMKVYHYLQVSSAIIGKHRHRSDVTGMTTSIYRPSKWSFVTTIAATGTKKESVSSLQSRQRSG